MNKCWTIGDVYGKHFGVSVGTRLLFGITSDWTTFIQRGVYLCLGPITVFFEWQPLDMA